MEKKNITPVVFRKWNDSIIALFPYEIENNKGSISSYQQIGQHGAADYSGIMENSSPATEAEYSELKKELESYPYNYRLVVIGRRSYWTYLKALNALRGEKQLA